MPFKENGGQTKFSEIASEFGGRKPHNMSEYYKGGRWIQDNSINIKVTPEGLKPSATGSGLQFMDNPISYAANEFYLIKCNAEPFLHDYLFANGNYAGGYIIITSVKTYAVRYPVTYAALSESDKEFYDDVYEIRGNAAHSYPVSASESAASRNRGGISVINNGFRRGQNNMYRSDEKYGLGGNVDILNPSNIPIKTYEDPTTANYGDGTEVKFSNYHDSYSSIKDELRQTSNQTSRTTANPENTSYTTSNITAKTTAFNTTYNTTIRYYRSTDFLTHFGPSYSGFDYTTSRQTTWTQVESRNRNTSRTTNKSTYFSTSRETSSLTVFNTSYNTEYTFWD